MSDKELLKILIGAAWIDGVIQAEERKYLHQMAAKYQLQEDTEIKSLLSEIKPVQPQQCYQWLETYLGDNPNTEDYQGLLESIAALIYSDGDVDIREANLLNKIQLLEANINSHPSVFNKLLKIIQKLYREAIEEKV